MKRPGWREFRSVGLGVCVCVLAESWCSWPFVRGKSKKQCNVFILHSEVLAFVCWCSMATETMNSWVEAERRFLLYLGDPSFYALCAPFICVRNPIIFANSNVYCRFFHFCKKATTVRLWTRFAFVYPFAIFLTTWFYSSQSNDIKPNESVAQIKMCRLEFANSHPIAPMRCPLLGFYLRRSHPGQWTIKSQLEGKGEDGC